MWLNRTEALEAFVVRMCTQLRLHIYALQYVMRLIIVKCTLLARFSAACVQADQTLPCRLLMSSKMRTTVACRASQRGWTC